MNKPIWTLVGFIIFCLGVLSLILSMVGLRFSFLSFIYDHGVLSLVIQVLAMFAGIVIMYVSRVSDEE
jgi:hypothetical protein